MMLPITRAVAEGRPSAALGVGFSPLFGVLDMAVLLARVAGDGLRMSRSGNDPAGLP
jgi:hypothetical protein